MGSNLITARYHVRLVMLWRSGILIKLADGQRRIRSAAEKIET